MYFCFTKDSGTDISAFSIDDIIFVAKCQAVTERVLKKILYDSSSTKGCTPSSPSLLPQGEKGANSFGTLIFPLALARERGRGEGRTLGLLPAKMIAYSFSFYSTPSTEARSLKKFAEGASAMLTCTTTD